MHSYMYDLQVALCPADHFLGVTRTRNSAVADKLRDAFSVILSNVVLYQTRPALVRSA